MGMCRDVNFKITGQTNGDTYDKDYKIVKAKLEVLCAEYGLDLEETYR